MSKKYINDGHMCWKHKHWATGTTCPTCKKETQEKRAARRQQVALLIALGGPRSWLESAWQREGQQKVESALPLINVSRLGECDASSDRLREEATERIKQGVPLTTHQGQGKDSLPSSDAGRRTEVCLRRSERRHTVESAARRVSVVRGYQGEYADQARAREEKDELLRRRRLDRQLKARQQSRRLSNPVLDATTALWIGEANPARQKPAAEARDLAEHHRFCQLMDRAAKLLGC